jgi:hypothetical protein
VIHREPPSNGLHSKDGPHHEAHEGHEDFPEYFKFLNLRDLRDLRGEGILSLLVAALPL